jgi:hypothetical protein
MYRKLLVEAALLILVGSPPFDAQGRAPQSPSFGLAQNRPFDPAQSTPFDPAQSTPFDVAQGRPGAWRSAPEYVRLFAPPRAHTGAYHAYVSQLDLDSVLRQLASEPALLHPPGAWTPQAVVPSDAFGQTGNYDRWRLARLYGAQRPVVARGPRASDGRTPSEAWTLISPYPDASLKRLEPGTLLIVLDLTNR